MSGFFQQFVAGASSTFLGTGTNLRDYTHASKTFTTNGFGNAPKFKWLYHVYFDINKDYVSNNGAAIFPETTNYGVLVKNIDLPKYEMNVIEMNQYNRKRLVQTKINYDPVNIVFHDDNLDQIKKLWAAYYSYYYYDPSNPQSIGPRTQPGAVSSKLNIKNTYDPNINDQQNWGYSGDITTASIETDLGYMKGPFFKSIRIYGFNQHNFSGYELINPMISSFSHDQYNYYETNGIMENKMTVKYESVNYFSGALNGQSPDALVTQFGQDAIYDRRLSPIGIPGSNKTILGQGGLVDAGEGIWDNISNGNYLEALRIAGRTAQTFPNKQSILSSASSELLQGLRGVAQNPQTYRSSFNFPAAGAAAGSGSQVSNSTNIPAGPVAPAPQPTSSNPGPVNR